MAPSIEKYINTEMECEDLIECINGSTELDKEVYFLILEEGKKSIDDVADRVNKDRSTAYRSIQRLKENGFLEQEKEGQKGGGYIHIYSATDPEKVAERMQNKLNEWYAEIGLLIFEFRNRYGQN